MSLYHTLEHTPTSVIPHPGSRTQNSCSAGPLSNMGAPHLQEHKKPHPQIPGLGILRSAHRSPCPAEAITHSSLKGPSPSRKRTLHLSPSHDAQTHSGSVLSPASSLLLLSSEFQLFAHPCGDFPVFPVGGERLRPESRCRAHSGNS